MYIRRVRVETNRTVRQSDSPGSLDLFYSRIDKLGANLKIDDTLNFDRSRARTLPANLEISADLSLGGTGITDPPSTLKVG